MQQLVLKMTNEFPHRKPTRYKDYDYSLPGYYFITICSYEMKHSFGCVNNCKMIPNDTGVIVNNCWNEIQNHYKNVELDYYQLMPNHFHGIVIIDSPIENVGDGSPVPQQKTEREGKPFAYDKSVSLSDIIGYFKFQSTKAINELSKNTGNKIWQRSFYDHVIRNEKELYEIRKYIEQNPVKWDLEKNATENLFI